MKKLFFIFFTISFSFTVSNAQSIKRRVISTFGNSNSNSNTYLSSTFGQTSNIGTISDGSNFIRQGFEQPLNNLIIVYGCTDSLANNYNPFATVDDSTCLYSPFVFGCTDTSALLSALLQHV